MRECFKSSELGRIKDHPPPTAVTLSMVLPVTAKFQQYEAALTGQRSGNSRSFQGNRHSEPQERLNSSGSERRFSDKSS